MLISTAYAQSAGAAPAGGGILEMFLPLVLIFVIFYFLLIRPQQKRQKQHQAKLAAVRRGDKVILGGGMMGTVKKVLDDDEIQVEIADGVEVRVLKSTMIDVISKTEPAKDSGKKGSDKSGDKDDAKAPANDGEEKKGGLGGLLGKKK
jgi:preprotein translocase subunit YajC